MTATVVYTIGHSTRPLEELVALLQDLSIQVLVDIRTIPRSRTNPQFNKDSLESTLEEYGIQYKHMKELGGLRRAGADSLNTGWRNASFRGFADYMRTEEFANALNHLIRIARTKVTAIMCAEAVPWRCHRSLVADALLVRGVQVLDLIGSAPPRPHQLTSFARVTGTQIAYPPETLQDDLPRP